MCFELISPFVTSQINPLMDFSFSRNCCRQETYFLFPAYPRAEFSCPEPITSKVSQMGNVYLKILLPTVPCSSVGLLSLPLLKQHRSSVTLVKDTSVLVMGRTSDMVQTAEPWLDISATAWQLRSEKGEQTALVGLRAMKSPLWGSQEKVWSDAQRNLNVHPSCFQAMSILPCIFHYSSVKPSKPQPTLHAPSVYNW